MPKCYECRKYLNKCDIRRTCNYCYESVCRECRDETNTYGLCFRTVDNDIVCNSCGKSNYQWIYEEFTWDVISDIIDPAFYAKDCPATRIALKNSKL